MTFRRSYQGQILGRFMLAATSAPFPASLFPKSLSAHPHPMIQVPQVGGPLHQGPAAVPLSPEAVTEPCVEGPQEQRLS